MTRGKIHSKGRRMQILDFSNIRYGKITPTDIDGIIEYKDKGFIIFEIKYSNNEMPYGQALALERLCDRLGERAVLIVASHHEEDVTNDVDSSTLQVDKVYWNQQYRAGYAGTVKEISDRFILFLECRTGNGHGSKII